MVMNWRKKMNLIDKLNLKEGDLIAIHFYGAVSGNRIFLRYDEGSKEPYVCVANGQENNYHYRKHLMITACWAESNVKEPV